MKLPSVVLLALLAAISSLSFAQVRAYSDEPIRSPLFEPAQILVETVKTNNWLRENLPKTPTEQHQKIREYLHALIDSKIKEIYAREKSILPKQPDISLAILFSWASRLGVYGADITYEAVRGKYPVAPPPSPLPPAGLKLNLDGELLNISSELGKWSATIPYYFFVFAANDITDAEAKRTQQILVSMGTARDARAPGFSQATLGIVYAPQVHSSGFVDTWSERMGVTGIPKKKIDSTALESQAAYDSNTRLHKEVVFLAGTHGSMALLYSGLDGTYQWNRRHFIDFIKALRIDQ